MIFTPTPLAGAWIVDQERLEDERGWFARTFCAREFQAHGLQFCIAQCSVSFNRQRGTLRGLHHQAPPHAEAKLVRCTRGAIFDVIVDLRADSPSAGRWYGAELDDRGRMLFVPQGFAHGFMTLSDDSEVLYLMNEFYQRESARRIAWNDPALAIRWPREAVVMSDSDRNAPPWNGSLDG